MNEEIVRVQTIQPMDMLSLSVLVLFLGFYLNRRLRVLSENYIPPAVTGGLIFALATWGVYLVFDIEVDFDMRIRDLLLLVFFSTVGLSARWKTLISGGRSIVVLASIAGVFLVFQNVIGIVIAVWNGAHPAYGLLAGSISFAGGHGTAIAWGAVGEEAGLRGASGIGLAFATFGLVAGGLVGGPIAKRLIRVHGIAPPPAEERPKVEASLEPAPDPDLASRSGWLYPVLSTLLVLAICVSLGDLVNRFLSGGGVRLPGFLTAMFAGIVVTNLAETIDRPLARATIDRFGEVSLHVFLAMSMMAIELWTLTDAASVIVVVLIAQVLLMTIFAEFVVFRLMGRDYDAVVMAAGFAGMGLGATPIAIANMEAVAQRYGPSAKAIVVVPLVGAFFLDLLNAGTIGFFIRVLNAWLS